MRTIIKIAAAASAAVIMTAPAAGAAVTFDPTTGTGFVGKGDVQTALGWNNKQLQQNAETAVFTYSASRVDTVEWTCVSDHNDNIQERHHTTTSTLSGVASSVARENSKGKDGSITGFFLTGFTGTVSESSTTDGPPLLSCPNANSTFQLDSVEETSETIAGGLYVNGVLIP